MIHIAKPLTIRGRYESKLANGKPGVGIHQGNAHHVDIESTEKEQA
jgi:hypothetical protein